MIEPSAELWGSLAAAFLLGLFSSGHCLGMCGGIMGALSVAIPPEARGRRWRLLLGYNAGRIASYSLMGLVAGALAASIAPSSPLLRLVAGLLLIAMGLYLAGWWRGLLWLERGGQHLWRYLQPLGRSLIPVRRLPQALLLGGLWGWLPCGLVYTALAYALAQGQALAGGAVMLAFGLGTLPAVLAAGLAAERLTALLRRPRLRQLLALSIIAFGVWTLWPSLGFGGHGNHQQHQNQQHSQSAPDTQEEAAPHHH